MKYVVVLVVLLLALYGCGTETEPAADPDPADLAQDAEQAPPTDDPPTDNPPADSAGAEGFEEEWQVYTQFSAAIEAKDIDALNSLSYPPLDVAELEAQGMDMEAMWPMLIASISAGSTAAMETHSKQFGKETAR